MRWGARAFGVVAWSLLFGGAPLGCSTAGPSSPTPDAAVGDAAIPVKRDAKPGNPDGGQAVEASVAEPRLVLDSAMTNIGKEPALKVPADFLPDQDKPEGIAAALEKFGIVRPHGDGGVTGPNDVLPDEDEAP